MTRIAGAAEASEAPRELEDWFPGRWDAKRAIHQDLRPGVAAAAAALRQAGWWTPGGGAVSGGLVVGVDTHGEAPAIAFARAIQRPETTVVRPSAFIQSLPSTPASTFGLLFGLSEYQTTVATGGAAGIDALAHAVDLLALGRCARVLVVALSVGPASERLGAAVALEPGLGSIEIERSCGASSPASPWEESAAAGLRKLVRTYADPGTKVVHHDSTWGISTSVVVSP